MPRNRNKARGSEYERDWAKRLRAVWPTAYRVERSGAGREKGDIGGTPRLHWSIRSGLRIDWRTALGDAAREVDEFLGSSVGQKFPIAGLVDRSARPLKRYVLMELDDFLAYLQWRDR